MSLRVGFDLDGTVADMYSVLRREAETLFGAELRAASPARTVPSKAKDSGSRAKKPAPGLDELRLTSRQQTQLWDRVQTIENFWTTLPELEPGIIARIAKTATDRRWEVIFLTTRPSSAGETTQLQSQRWLDAHGFPFPSVYVVQRSRGKIADALQLDIVVDDRPENCLDIAVESKAKAVLVWHGDLTKVPIGAKRMGVKAVNTIAAALAIVEQYDEMRNAPGVLKSLKRLIGQGEDR